MTAPSRLAAVETAISTRIGALWGIPSATYNPDPAAVEAFHAERRAERAIREEAEIKRRAAMTFDQHRHECAATSANAVVERDGDCLIHTPGRYGDGELNDYGERVYDQAYTWALDDFDAGVIRYRAAMAVPGAAEDAGFAAVGDDDLADWVMRAIEAEEV